MRSMSLGVALALLALANTTCAGQDEPYDADCLPLKIEGRHGPFDYRTAKQNERDLVEKVHFNEHYQAYRMGKRKFQKVHDHIIEAPASGFSYTLWAFPNHHRALAAIEDLGHKQNTEKVAGMGLRLHCYFQRAVRFVPDDGLVRALYGYFYARRNRGAEAEVQIAKAVDLMPDDMNVLNYAATAYLELGNVDKASEYARRAYAAGYPFPGLRARIEKAGGAVQ